MGVYDINGAPVSSFFVRLGVEHGGINSSGQVDNALTNIALNYRTSKAAKVYSGSTISVSVDGDTPSSLYVYEYASNFGFIKRTSVGSSPIALSQTTSYIMCAVTFASSSAKFNCICIESSAKMYEVNKFNTRSNFEKFVYEVDTGIFTSGCLMLPPNYKPDGKSVPLLVYAHGSNGYASWDADLGTMTGGSTYFPYMEYLRDEGFAIFDCFSITSKYITSISDVDANTNFWSHIAMAAYLTGVEYVLSRYNIDPDNVNLYCKSLGGQIAGGMANTTNHHFKTISMLCPWINNMTATSIGWSVDKRTMLADDWGLTGNVSGVFLQNNFEIRSESGQAFLLENLPIISGVNPAWRYFGRTAAQKFSDIVDRDYTKTDYPRSISCPVKIWGAQDDADINFNTLTEFIAQAQNGGCDAFLRVMPNGTGGHHSVDTDANALKSSGITALGITYTNMPTAYVEMVEFIRSRP